MSRRFTVVMAALAAIGLVLPWFVYPVFATQLLCFALFAVSLDLLFGYVGLLSFGQAMFWGGGGYAAAVLLQRAHVDDVFAILGGIVYAAVLAFLVGAISVRRSGIYFAMITLAVAQIQYFTAYQFTDLTGGENGINLATRGLFFGVHITSDRTFYYVVLVLVALGVWLALRVVRSPFGRVLQAMRENEPRAIALGFRVNRYKLAVFTLAGALAGFAGALAVLANRLAGLDMVDWHTSGAVVMMSVLGGVGTVAGPIVGAGIFQSLDYFVSKTAIGEETNMVMGAIFGLCVLLFRRGIVGSFLVPGPKRAKITD